MKRKTIKDLIQELEEIKRRIEKLENPWQDSPYIPYPFKPIEPTIPYDFGEDDDCLIRKWGQEHPNEPIWISCPCKRCNPFMFQSTEIIC